MKLTAAVRLALTLGISTSALSFIALAELPVPCAGTACVGAGGPQFFYDPGLATPPVNTPTIAGTTMTIEQRTDKALLNWLSFNITRDSSVVFRQPGTDSIALNRVWDPSGNPSLILGRLSANGQIYLINRNGILFGAGAQVDVHSLVASSLDVADDVLEDGVFAPLRDGRPAFALAERFDAGGNPVPVGSVEVEDGATLTSGTNGRIMLLAPDVENRGTIETPDGQAILAAGERVWIADSDDEDLRGFIVEVDAGGTARNVGDILVGRGNASLVGLAVNQEGRVSAQTSVSLGGSIRLLARDTVDVDRTLATGALTLERSGALTFGEGSITEVLPDYADAATAIDEQAQPVSSVEAFGKTIAVQEGARVTATSGLIDFVASVDPAQPLAGETAGNGARIDITEGATLDVSGTEDVLLPMERNVLTVELRGNELKDAPVQRDGILYGKEIKVDIREGTPLADISGALANIQRGIAERTTTGGAITLRSEDAVSLAAGATLDVSGGSVRYDSGLIDTSRLVSGGRIYDIADADPNLTYDTILGSYEATSAKWGVSNTYVQSTGTVEAGYVEGKDAGSMTLLGNQMEIAGALKGETIAGTRQRQLPSSVTNPWTRPADELPLGGQVIFGDAGQLSATAGSANFRLPGVVFQAADGAADTDGMLVLDPAMFAAGGIKRVAVYSDGRILLPEDEEIALAPGGALTLVSGSVAGSEEEGSVAPSMQIDGDITLPSGAVVLRTIQSAIVGDEIQQDLRHVLAIGADAVLDVSGRWVNDAPAVAPTLPDDVVAIDGGSIRLTSAGGVDIAQGATMLLNGGAWLDRGGDLNAGAGGDLTIGSTLVNAIPTLHLGATVESYGLVEGGALNISVGGINIAATGAPGIRDGVWTIDPSFFRQGGFSSYNLTATHLGLDVAAGTLIEPRMQNRVLDAGMTATPSGVALASIAHLEVLPEYLRSPVDLSLTSRRSSRAAADLDAGLTLAAGAVIDADVGANVSLSSDYTLTVEGAVYAPAGSITLSLDNNSVVDAGFAPDRAIWLGEAAVLAAPAAVRLTPDPRGLRRGEVIDAGTVTLEAERGFIITGAGSLIDVGGGAATFDIARSSAAGTTNEAVEVAGAADAIDIRAAEGMVLAGGLNAQSAAVDGAAGGTLAIALDTSDPVPALQTNEFKYPTGARELALLNGDSAALLGGLQSGDSLYSTEDLTALRAENNGVESVAVVSLQQLQQSGLDAIDLKVRPVVRENAALGDARIRLDAGAELQARGRVTLDAPIIMGNGGDAAVEAAYVALGPTDTALRYAETPTSGAGTLTVRADLIDLTGDIAVQGFGAEDQAALALESRGDIRLTGLRVPEASSAEMTGSLKTAGDMRIDAAQIYPTTLSEFTLEATGAGSTVALSSPAGEAAAVPLSAGGSLNVKAARIVVDGTVRAPHGRITLEAEDRLTLAAGSVVSVAGSATPVPYGQTQFGVDWILPYESTLLRVVGGPDDEVWSVELPEKVVELVADEVELDAGAQVVLDGGGDLYAWEFIPGPGGSSDVLLTENAAGAFAILPKSALATAPLDPFLQYDGLQVGDTVEIAAGVAGLPAGEYALLPARYALLPGAFLLTPQAGLTALAAVDAFTTANGLSIVAARRGSALTGAYDSLWSGYVVETGAQLRQRAEYRESLASEFFADAGSSAGQLPADAGRLVIDAGASLSLGAAVQANAAGRGGQVDIVADSLAVVDALTGQTDRVELLAEGLSQLNVESLLLGGRRELTEDGTRIEADAESVVVESGVELELPEILLIAAADATGGDAGGVRVAGGATLRGVGAEAETPERYLVDGDAALLRVSSGGAVEVARSGVPADADAEVVLESGSVLVAGTPAATALAGGSITIDSSGNASSAATLTLGTDGALQLAASRISLGGLPAAGVAQGLALSQADLDALDVSNLFLQSASSIDLYGRLDLAVDDLLALDASELRGIAAAGALDVSLRAGGISWQGGDGAAGTPPADVPTGQLALTADTVRLGDGATADLSVQGFALTRLEGTDSLVVQGEGTLQTAGALELAAPWVTTTDGADWRIAADEALAVTAAGADDVAAPAAAGLGSRLELSGAQVNVDGRVLLPAGQVELHAAEVDAEGAGVRVAANALIDVAGLRETFLDQTLETPGGSVTLTADQGDVVVESGAGIDVSGAGGSLTVNAQGTAAIDGTLIADTLGGDAGSFALTAQSLGDFSVLNTALNAGGFGEARYFHLRSGDVTVGAGETLRARDVAIVLDGEPAEAGGDATGTFRLDGTIDAAGDSAGQIRIYAYGDVTLGDAARIDTHAVAEDRAGGEVELATTAGTLGIADGAVIDVRGTREVSYEIPLLDQNGAVVQRTDADGNLLFDALGQPLPALEQIVVADTGRVRYRLPRAALLDGDAQQPSLGGAVLGAGRVELEAFQVYADADGVIDAGDVAADASNPLYQDAADLMANEAAIRAALGVEDDATFHLLPGIEIQAADDLTLAAGWDLAQWRFGADGESGVLSLRAGGDLGLDQTLSDGVVRSADLFGVEQDILLDDASWSLRLAAGADLNSNDPLMVSSGIGDLTLGAGVVLRTGTGDIEVRSGRDLVLSDSSSAIYSTGIDAGIGTLDPLLANLYVNGVYPVLGGDVDILTGRNIEATASDQLINDWLWRFGGTDANWGELPQAWNVSIMNFKQGVAAFGGGNINITAGGDVHNLSAAVPTTARQVGTNTFDPANGSFSVESDEAVVQGGDSLVVDASGDIVGGIYYVGRGVGELTAGGSITRESDNGLYTILAVGDGEWRATAGQQAAIETVFNPTFVPFQSSRQGFSDTLASSFQTYSENSAVQLTALAGEVRLNQDLGRLLSHPFFSGNTNNPTSNPTDLIPYVEYPGSLQATSFSDDVVVSRSLALNASPVGQLEIYADGNVRAEVNASPTVTMLDAVNAAPLHGDDPEPVRIVARDGDIGGEQLNFDLAKAARLDAGGDIRNVRLDVQHLSRQDVTVLRAGGDIVHDAIRAQSGAFASSSHLLYYRVEGPGRADFIAGGDIDLGTAGGILTLGNTNNAFLPEGGATVTVVAGLREEPRFDAFIEEYLVSGTGYAEELAAYLVNYETNPALGDVEKFRALPSEQQRPFLWQVFFSELRESGVEATTSGSDDYSRGYAAIETLFPEEVYKDEAAARDLSLLLSRITTLAGGDITMLVPGGSANAGVATSSQLIKPTSELGIVVQGRGDVNAFVRGDFAVNQSRVFTLDGGDLLMWSSYGDIDAGRGAKSAIAAPPPLVTTDENGNTVITFPPAIAGSGIRAVVTSEGVEPGDVFLFAPAGVVSAGDAGIGSEGNVTIGAVEVIGADNIDVGGVAVGVPVADTGSLAAGLTGVSNVASAATKSSEESLGGGAASEEAGATPLADAAFAVLDVIVLGFGEDGQTGNGGTQVASPGEEDE